MVRGDDCVLLRLITQYSIIGTASPDAVIALGTTSGVWGRGASAEAGGGSGRGAGPRERAGEGQHPRRPEGQDLRHALAQLERPGPFF